MILGSKDFKSFHLDFRTGNIIPPLNSGDETDVDTFCHIKQDPSLGEYEPLFIIRTDYCILLYSAEEAMLLWKACISEINAIGNNYHGSAIEITSSIPNVCKAQHYLSLQNYNENISMVTPIENVDVDQCRPLYDKKNVGFLVMYSPGLILLPPLAVLFGILCYMIWAKKKLDEGKNDVELTDAEIKCGTAVYLTKKYMPESVIAIGSEGTTIFKSICEGNDPIAVKQVAKDIHADVKKEVFLLQKLKNSKHVVQVLGIHENKEVVNILLEYCDMSLYDLVEHQSICWDNNHGGKKQNKKKNLASDEIQTLCNGLVKRFWPDSGNRPSDELLNLLSGIVSGISALHMKNIVHRDIKPENILLKITEEGVCAKISDLGAGKQLNDGASSLGLHTTSTGTGGWRPVEKINSGDQGPAVDIFGLGCVIFYCVTGGLHPFGSVKHRERNIMNGTPLLGNIKNNPEAIDLITGLVHKDATLRPLITDVLRHPFFMCSEKRLSFLGVASDTIAFFVRQNDLRICNDLQNAAPKIFSGNNAWIGIIDFCLFDHLVTTHKARYDTTHVHDLLRLIRNISHHYIPLPEDLKELVGSYPHGVEAYFKKKFPHLVFEVHKTLSIHCPQDKALESYIGR